MWCSLIFFIVFYIVLFCFLVLFVLILGLFIVLEGFILFLAFFVFEGSCLEEIEFGIFDMYMIFVVVF